MVYVVDVSCYDGFNFLLLMQALQGSHNVVVAVVGDFNENVWSSKGFGLLLYYFEAVENVGVHVNVGY